jgi:NADH dehydrogenase
MSVMLAEDRPDQATGIVNAPDPQRKRVVIVGGGFAGLAAAHALWDADSEVVLIDRRNHHIFVATAVLSPAEIAAPIRQLEAKQQNVSVLLAEVTGVDVASRTIEAPSPGVGVRKLRSTIWWSRPACARATSGTTSSRDMRRGSRTSTTPKRSGPKS